MTHLIKTNPSHVWNPDGSKLTALPTVDEHRSFLHQLEVPHFLNTNPRLGKVTVGHASMIIPSDMVIQVGDHIENEYGWKAMVTTVVNLRPARGDWGERGVHCIEVTYI